MAKITVVEPTPFNGLQGMYLVPSPTQQECQIQVENDGDEAYIHMDQSDIRKLIQELQGILEGKEVSNG